ncbi:MAG: histidine kinase [Clostridium sp.]|nr:histidine kinase [Clostridium sp.]
MEKMIKEKLHQVILDLESEQIEIERQIQEHKDAILQAKRYLESLYEKEDTDVKIFSPRNIESRYKEDIAKGKEQIRIFEKENQAFYHKQNMIKKRISALRDVWQELSMSSSDECVIKNDTFVNSIGYEKNDVEYAQWVLSQGDRSAGYRSKPEARMNEQISASDDADGIEMFQDETNMLHVMQALDSDRKRIANDLHDTIVQDLVHTIHMLELCGRYMEQDAVQAKLQLVSVEKYLRETIQRARNFISDLRPMIFDDIGFREALLNAVEEQQKYTSMMIVADVEDLPDISNEICIVLYRIAMELLRNAIFHSGGDRVSMTLKRENGVIQLQVVDNGKGFSLKDNTDKHFGLELVKERAYLIGASFHIGSTDEGTCAQVVLKE